MWRTNFWDTVKADLQRQGIEVVEAEVTTGRVSDLDQRLPYVVRAINSFPTMFIFARGDWNRMVAEPTKTPTELKTANYDIFNGTYSPSDRKIIDRTTGMSLPMTDMAVRSWVGDKLSHFASPTPIASPVAPRGGAGAGMMTVGPTFPRRFTPRPA